MPNYKQCRFCSNKFIPKGNERICPDCTEDVKMATNSQEVYGGSPAIVEGTISDGIAEKMRAVAEASLTKPVAIPKEFVEKVEVVDSNGNVEQIYPPKEEVPIAVAQEPEDKSSLEPEPIPVVVGPTAPKKEENPDAQE